MIIYDYTCMLLYPTKICTNKPENQAFFRKKDHHPSLLPNRTVAKGHQGCNKVMARCHWASLAKAKATLLRLTIFTWSDSAAFPQSTMPQFWGCQYPEVFISLGWKLTLVIQVHGFFCWHGHHGVLELSFNSLESMYLYHIHTLHISTKVSSNYPTSWPQNDGCFVVLVVYLLPPWWWIHGDSPMKLESSSQTKYHQKTLGFQTGVAKKSCLKCSDLKNAGKKICFSVEKKTCHAEKGLKLLFFT